MFIVIGNLGSLFGTQSGWVGVGWGLIRPPPLSKNVVGSNLALCHWQLNTLPKLMLTFIDLIRRV